MSFHFNYSSSKGSFPAPQTESIVQQKGKKKKNKEKGSYHCVYYLQGPYSQEIKHLSTSVRTESSHPCYLSYYQEMLLRQISEENLLKPLEFLSLSFSELPRAVKCTLCAVQESQGSKRTLNSPQVLHKSIKIIFTKIINNHYK